MLRAVRVLLILLFLSLAAVLGGLVWFARAPLELPASSMDFSIVSGSSLRSAAQQISASGIPLSPRAFTLLARIAGKATQVKAGSYAISQGETPWTLLRKITQGEYQWSEVLLVEGWTFAQMRAALDASDALRHDTPGMSDAQVMGRLGLPRVVPEGLFFPDTYLFAKGESDLAILARAHRTMVRMVDAVWQERDPDIPVFTSQEALVLASLIEKETGDKRERALVAGVFANRLKQGMRLQTDPTVIYGLGDHYKGALSRRDLERDSPYNTYTRDGLPPYPIAMPGRAALVAAVKPAKTDALYFVARGDGTHQFSRSLDEHNRAVAKFQRGAHRLGAGG